MISKEDLTWRAGAPPLTLLRTWWQTAVVLFKLRIVALLLLAAFGGAALAVAAGGQAALFDWLLLAVTGALSAAGASGLNEYLERDRDQQMRRTAKRPLATGAVAHPAIVLWLSVSMIAVAVVAALLFNPWLALWELAGALIYVGVYTVWLKPRTTLNIVIGGAAGSCAVISGGAAVGEWTAVSVWLLAALLFVWTPVHFWSLALAYCDDYARAAFPMLPAHTSTAAAARWTALHTGGTAMLGLILGLWPRVSPFYLLPVLLATGGLIYYTVHLLIDPQRRTALALFHASNLYLTVVLIAILIVFT